MTFLTDNPYERCAFDTIRNLPKRDRYGRFQLDFLKAQGLIPSSWLLDFGCGDLRLGEKAIPYLAWGRYWGADLNQQALDRGLAHLAGLRIDTSRARTFCTTDASLALIADATLDMAFSNSVFSHLTLNTIVLCLLSVRRALKPGASYFSSMILLPDGASFAEPHTWMQEGRPVKSFPARDPYHYTMPMVEAAAALAGMRCSLCPGYGHPFQKMVRFSSLA